MRTKNVKISPVEAGNFNVRPAHEKILKALSQYHYLSAAQILRILEYKSSSMTYVQTLMKQLTDNKFSKKIFLPRPSQYGSAPFVYILGMRGVKYLDGQGLKRQYRLRPQEQQASTYPFLAHTLACNDFLISVELLCRTIPTITLDSMLHERALKQKPAKVPDSEGRQVAVIPDGWVNLRINDSTEQCLSLELDRGTERLWQWQRKVERLLLWKDEPYRNRFGTSSLTIAVVAIPGNQRMKDLQRWTESKLKESGSEDTDIFRFTDLDPSRVIPKDLFLSPIWYRPFDNKPVSILEGVVQ